MRKIFVITDLLSNTFYNDPFETNPYFDAAEFTEYNTSKEAENAVNNEIPDYAGTLRLKDRVLTVVSVYVYH